MWFVGGGYFLSLWEHKISKGMIIIRFILAFVRELWAFVKEFFVLNFIGMKLRIAIWRANMLHRIRDKRYWVLPGLHGINFIVATSKEIKLIGGKFAYYKKNDFLTLEEKMFYRTPLDKSGRDRLSEEEKRKAFLRYKSYQKWLNPVERGLGGGWRKAKRRNERAR
jgi:hypothetical protein